jgi:thioesterase domain-containing protein
MKARQKGPGGIAESVLGRFRRLAARIGLAEGERATATDGAAEASLYKENVYHAFTRATRRYQMRPLPVRATLFRPPLEPAFVLNDDKWFDKFWFYIFHDNGFAKYCEDIEIYETSGDHNSVVLEPNVRSLVRRLRRCIEVAETEYDAKVRGVPPPSRDPVELELAHTVRGPVDWTSP